MKSKVKINEIEKRKIIKGKMKPKAVSSGRSIKLIKFQAD